jgi:hypothetical protein
MAKYRNYEAIVYPESLPDSWLTLLRECKLPVVLSPIHDQDIDAEGELKKAHYHLVIQFDGPVTARNAIECLSFINVKYVEPVRSFVSWCRYTAHLDNPEKAQYSIQDVQLFGGAKFTTERRMTTDEKNAILKDITNWVIASPEPLTFRRLLLESYDHAGWLQVLTANTFYVKSLLYN